MERISESRMHEMRKTYLEALGITDDEIQFMHRFFKLREDADRVSRVVIGQLYGSGNDPKSVTVDLKEMFSGIDEFRQYLKSNSLPARNIEHYHQRYARSGSFIANHEGNPEIYRLTREQIQIDFCKLKGWSPHRPIRD